MEKHFVIARIRVDEHEGSKFTDDPGAKDLVQKLGGGQGLPWFAFLSANGEVLATSNEPPLNGKKGGNIGFPAQPNEVDWFLEMCKRGAPNMTAQERAEIEKVLRAPKK